MGEAVNGFEQQVVEQLKTHLPEDLARRDVYVGFSGGADSTALLLALSQGGIPVVAVHFDHGLRGEASTADAAWCERFCRKRSIRFLCERLPVADNVNANFANMEDVARRLRLDAWARLTDARHAVALGHHRDDQLETLFLRLGRGGNASGICGLRKFAMVEGVALVRPLLSFRRVEIEDYLRAQGIDEWREDASNQDVRLARNAVRHRVLPLLRDCFGVRYEAGVMASLDALALDAEYLERLAEKLLERPVTASFLAGVDDALLPRVLRLLARRELGRDVVFGRRAVERVREEVSQGSQRPRRLTLGGGVELLLDGERVVLVASDVACPCLVEWRWRDAPVLDWPALGCRFTAAVESMPRCAGWDSGSWVERFALGALDDVLVVRGWRAGDRMVPFGRTSLRKVNDLLSGAGVPVERRPFHPVVCSGGGIVWVPGVRRGELGRLAPGGGECVVLRCETDCV